MFTMTRTRMCNGLKCVYIHPTVNDSISVSNNQFTISITQVNNFIHYLKTSTDADKFKHLKHIMEPIVKVDMHWRRLC